LTSQPAIRGIGTSGLSFQIPFSSYLSHCDINAWNNALLQGYDPRGQDGQIWNGNKLSTQEILGLFPNGRQSIPLKNTAGFAFYDDPTDDMENIVVHMVFYERGNDDFNYTVYQSNGIEPTSSMIWDIRGSSVKTSIFVPLPLLSY